MKKTKLTVEEMRERQIAILDTIDAFCKKNHITYFLIAGTLLGAVRHKGYIPWDDDIDIVMMREDYSKFVNSFNKDGYYIAAVERDMDYPLPYAKICMENTLIIEPSRLTRKPLGVNVDLFPIDYVPDNEKALNRQMQCVRRYQQLLGLKDTIVSKDRSLIKNAALVISRAILAPISYRYFVKKLTDVSTKYNAVPSRLCGELVWGIGKKEIVSSTVFSDTIELSFERKKYLAPVGWDEWLTKRYGSYMELPPMSKQVNHHINEAYWLE